MRCQWQDFTRATVARSDRLFSVGNCVLGAVAALLIAFPSLAAPPTNVGGHIPPLISSAIDRTHKSDRAIPASGTFAARWNAQDPLATNKFRSPYSEKPTERQMKGKVPFGCDPAFGPLVNANFSARCLASAGGRARLAVMAVLKVRLA
jgi:hypothetical protein